MTRYYGAQHPLDKLVTTHLFALSPNNGGSTFLKNVLATCRRTWNLAREGQHTFGFLGPSTGEMVAPLLWAADQKWIDILTDATAYDWPGTRHAWYFQSFAHSPTACVFVTKSPPFLLNASLLREQFVNTKFLVMVRDPYALVEGIRRSARRGQLCTESELLSLAANHVMTCFRYQRDNVEAYPDDSLFFTYEAMCERPDQVAGAIRSWLPELDDLVLRQRVPVKGRYDEMLRNMNDQQIAQLSERDLTAINQVFAQHPDLLDYFGYRLRRETTPSHD
jgi:hypothetical protein